MKLRYAALIAAVIAGGCQDYIFEQKCPDAVVESEATFSTLPRTPVDILFVVDNSCSMADEQENLATNFQGFIDRIVGVGDYRIAVVTTDQSSGDAIDERAGLAVKLPSSGEPYFHTPSLNTQGCMNTDIPHGCFRGPNPDTRRIDSMLMQDPATQVSSFIENVRVGSCGSGREEGLAAMASALSMMAPGGCNEDFLRPEANLVVIIVSDEEDSSPGGVDTYVDALIAAKNNANQVRVATIVGSVNGQASECRIDTDNQGVATNTCGGLCDRQDAPDSSNTSCENNGDCIGEELCYIVGQNDRRCRHPIAFNYDSCASCSFFEAPDCCSADPGSRYVNFAQAVEARVVAADPSLSVANCRAAVGQPAACLIDSICQEQFAATLERIATELVITDAYPLSPPARNPAGVRARLRTGEQVQELVNGSDFRVSDNGQQLTVINSDAIPQSGESIEIYFVSEVIQEGNLRGACATPTE